jgi:hypothetical protein
VICNSFPECSPAQHDMRCGVVAALLEAGADVAAESPEGGTPLSLALEAGCAQVHRLSCMLSAIVSLSRGSLKWWLLQVARLLLEAGAKES